MNSGGCNSLPPKNSLSPSLINGTVKKSKGQITSPILNRLVPAPQLGGVRGGGGLGSIAITLVSQSESVRFPSGPKFKPRRGIFNLFGYSHMESRQKLGSRLSKQFLKAHLIPDRETPHVTLLIVPLTVPLIPDNLGKPF